jgi:hypothetical protein
MRWLAIRGMQGLEACSLEVRVPAFRFLLYGTVSYFILAWFYSDREFRPFLASKCSFSPSSN